MWTSLLIFLHFILVCIGILMIGFEILMIKPHTTQKEFYGTTTVGAKGQVVIPAEARKAMNLKDGEKLLVFGMGCDMIAFTKLANVEKFAAHLAGNLKNIRSVLKKTERS
ncbi:AbrB/MazE/SpoVT family DNA-binding domain-containing protein [Patescibacteria group bacterium]|nr:MAG: AbrB/MazE/SpoVT family DNA-binding domain-containing protein [Patescibacteria group bacterium]